MNIVAIDLTSEIHYISIEFNGNKYHLEFNEENRAQRNDWENKIQVIKTHEPKFDFAKCDRFAYAAGPGSYTGARLAYTFLQTIKLITGKDFFAFPFTFLQPTPPFLHALFPCSRYHSNTHTHTFRR